MSFPEIVESKNLLWGITCAVDNVRARRKGILGKLYEIQISPERGLRNSLKFPSYFGMEYVRPWNMGKKLLESWKIWKSMGRIIPYIMESKNVPNHQLVVYSRMYPTLSHFFRSRSSELHSHGRATGLRAAWAPPHSSGRRCPAGASVWIWVDAPRAPNVSSPVLLGPPKNMFLFGFWWFVSLGELWLTGISGGSITS